jgi:hypothetical protein
VGNQKTGWTGVEKKSLANEKILLDAFYCGTTKAIPVMLIVTKNMIYEVELLVHINLCQ